VRTDFYATAAQVVATLLLAYIVERRWTEPSKTAPGAVAVLFVSFVTGALVVAEMLALAGVAGAGASWSPPVIVAAVGLALWLIVGAWLVEYAAETLPDGKLVRRRPLAAGFLGASAILSAMLVLFGLPVLTIIVAVIVA
jgi:hypothetical protein